jgi:hypothetical protein
MPADPLPPVQFSYTKHASDIYGTVYRPESRVAIRTERGNWLYHAMIVDSGADFSVLPKAVGEFLGLRKSATERLHHVGAVGGAIWIVMRRVKMRIGPHEFTADAGWASTDAVPALLGRADVFDKFDVRFRQRERLTEFHWRES